METEDESSTTITGGSAAGRTGTSGEVAGSDGSAGTPEEPAETEERTAEGTEGMSTGIPVEAADWSAGSSASCSATVTNSSPELRGRGGLGTGPPQTVFSQRRNPCLSNTWETDDIADS